MLLCREGSFSTSYWPFLGFVLLQLSFLIPTGKTSLRILFLSSVLVQCVQIEHESPINGNGKCTP